MYLKATALLVRATRALPRLARPLHISLPRREEEATQARPPHVLTEDQTTDAAKLCKRCGQPGHSGYACTRCWECGGEDHQASQCPQKKCYVCGEPGHLSSECTSPRAKTCYVCGKEGHKGRDCTEPRNCANCGQPGHKTAACPKPLNPVPVYQRRLLNH